MRPPPDSLPRLRALAGLRLLPGIIVLLTALGCRPEPLTTAPTTPAACRDVAVDEAKASVLEHEIRIFDREGHERTLASMIDELAERDVVLLGETHLDDVTHRVELAVLEGLAQRRTNRVVLSLEMFERDVQPLLDRYLAGEIDEATLLAQARPWGNYRPDYRPLVETARERKLPLVAANTPRPLLRQAAQGAEGFAEARAQHPTWLPDRVFPASDAYWARVDRTIRGHGPPSKGDRTYAVQNLWDNTMADAIVGAAMTHPDHVVLHVVGAFHIEHGDGTVAQVRRRAPKLDLATLTVVPTDDLARAEPEPKRADFVVYAHAYATGPSGDELAVAMPSALKFHLHLPEGPAPTDGWPLLVWLPDDEQRFEDSLLRWRLALGTEAAVIVIEPPHHTRARGGWIAERWAWPASLAEDLSAASVGLGRILEYTRRGFPVRGTPVLLAGEGAGGTLALWAALYGDQRDGVRVLAIDPALPRALRSAGIPERRSLVESVEVLGTLDDGTSAGLRGAELNLEIRAAVAPGGSRDTAVREALGLSTTTIPSRSPTPLPDPVAPMAEAGRPIDVRVAQPSALSESWGALYTSLLRARGHEARLVLGDGPATPGGRVLGLDALGAEQDSLLLGVFAEGAGLPRPVDVFGGAVIVLVPRTSGKAVTQRWKQAVARAEANQGFFKVPYRVIQEGDDATLRGMFEELRTSGHTEVLVVPAELCATVDRMRAYSEWMEARGSGLSLHWLPGLAHHVVLSSIPSE